MKNIEDLEKKFKAKNDILLILDYHGTITSTEPRVNSPLSNTTFKRVLENFARKEYIKIVIITDRTISAFKKEFGISLEEIDIYGVSNDEFQNEKGASFKKEEQIIDDVFAQNKKYNVIYAGDDKTLISKVKELGGNAIGILPLCPKGEKLVDFCVSQNKFEEFLITANNLYL